MIRDVNMVNQYNCFSKGNTFIITLSVKSEYNATTTFHHNEHQYYMDKNQLGTYNDLSGHGHKP